MNEKRIRVRLSEVYEQLVEATSKGFMDSWYFAGSCISSIIIGETPKDYDLFCTSNPGSLRKLNDFKWDRDPFYSPLAATVVLDGKTVQFVSKLHGKPQDVIAQFDFEHTQTFYIPNNNSDLLLTKQMLLATAARKLIYTGSDFPLSSLFRCKKMMSRGWSCSTATLMRIAYDIGTYDLTDTATLRTQLEGIDIAYFKALTDSLLDADADVGSLIEALLQ